MNTDFNTMWNFNDPIETRKNFQELREASLPKADLNYVLELETQIARTYSLESEFSEAHAILDRVEARLNENTPIAQIRYFLERGRTYNSANDTETAKDMFLRAFHACDAHHVPKYAIDAIHMLAIAEQDFDVKMKWTNQGIEIAKSATDPHIRRWTGIFYNNSGWDLFERERYHDALENFRACEAFHREAGTDTSIAEWSVAKTLRFLKKYEQAFEIQLRLLEKNSGNDPSGYTYEELAELYLLKKEPTKSKKYFGLAYEALSKDRWLLENETARLERLLEPSNPD